MRWKQARQFFRQTTAIVVSAALLLSTTPIPAAQAQFGPSPGGGGLGGLGGALKQLTPGNQPPPKRQPEPPAKAPPQPQPPSQSQTRSQKQDPARLQEYARTGSAAAQSSYLTDTNLFGGDYRDFDARGHLACRNACLEEAQCKAWTYGRSIGKCWLKDSVPLKSANDCCISGVKTEGSARKTASAKDKQSTRREELRKALDYFSEVESEIDLRILDPAEVAKIAGNTPQELADWIHDNIALVPYSGSLKGARGVLVDLEGNALDRSLLLAEMVSAKGYRVRLARAQLTEAAHLDHLLKFAGRRLVPSFEWLSSVHLAEQAVVDTARGVIGRQSADLLKEVSQFRNDPTEIARDERAAARAVLRDYWWVQVSTAGQWMDIHTVQMPLSKFSPDRTLSPETLPRRLKHVVTISLRVEVEGGNKPGNFKLIDFSVPAAELMGKTIRFVHLPVGTISGKSKGTNQDPIQRLADARAWLPNLIVGKDVFVDRFVAADGRILEATEQNLLPFKGAAEGGLGGSVAQPADFLTRSVLGMGKPPPPPARISSLSYQIQLQAPGDTPQTYTRTIFEQPASSQTEWKLPLAKALVGSTHLSIEPAKTSFPEFVRRLSEIANTLRTFIDAPSLEEEHVFGLAAVNVELQALNLIRWQWNQRSEHVFLAWPNVAAMNRTISGNLSSPTVSISTDIIENGVAVKPLDAIDSFQHRLVQGVTDTVAEAAVIARGKRPIFNAAVWHEAIVRHNEGTLRTISSNVDAPRLVANDVANGLVVVMPIARGFKKSPLWWRIDPQTGTTLGVDQFGRGGSLLEYGKVLLFAGGISLATLGIIFLADCLAARAILGNQGFYGSVANELGYADDLAEALRQPDEVFGGPFGLWPGVDISDRNLPDAFGSDAWSDPGAWERIAWCAAEEAAWEAAGHGLGRGIKAAGRALDNVRSVRRVSRGAGEAADAAQGAGRASDDVAAQQGFVQKADSNGDGVVNPREAEEAGFRPCNACFAPGTMVATTSGQRPIEEIKVGDQVLTRDETKPESPVFAAAVVEVHERTDQPIYKLVVENQTAGNDETFLVTPSHPFYVADQGFTKVENLRAGDPLADASGSIAALKVKLLTLLHPSGKSHNLTLANGYTFFVGQSKVWVHNNGNCVECINGACTLHSDPPSGSGAGGSAADDVAGGPGSAADGTPGPGSAADDVAGGPGSAADNSPKPEIPTPREILEMSDDALGQYHGDMVGQARSYFPRHRRAVGTAATADGPLLFIKSGVDGGPFGGTHRGGVPRLPGRGFTQGGPSQLNIATHVEGHLAAIMWQRGLNRATLFVTPNMCKICIRSFSDALPPRSRVRVVEPDGSVTVVRSSHDS